jgi:DNA-binding GntR family transcriptional regulator
VNRAALPLQVDRNSPVPLYFQVAQHVEQLIECGPGAGTRLENEIDLADQLGLSRPAIQRGSASDCRASRFSPHVANG